MNDIDRLLAERQRLQDEQHELLAQYHAIDAQLIVIVRELMTIGAQLLDAGYTTHTVTIRRGPYDHGEPLAPIECPDATTAWDVARAEIKKLSDNGEGFKALASIVDPSGTSIGIIEGN